MPKKKISVPAVSIGHTLFCDESTTDPSLLGQSSLQSFSATCPTSLPTCSLSTCSTPALPVSSSPADEVNLSECELKLATCELRPVGLSNMGNTCFFNSTLQALLATESLIFKLGIPSLLQQYIGCGQELKSDLHFTPHTLEKFPLSIDSSSTCNTLQPKSIQFLSLMNAFRSFAIEVRKNLFLSSLQGSPSYSSMARGFLSRTTNTLSAHQAIPAILCPKSLFYAIATRWPIYRRLRQQDAHEFLRLFLGFLGDEEDSYFKKCQQMPTQHHTKSSNGVQMDSMSNHENPAPDHKSAQTIPYVLIEQHQADYCEVPLAKSYNSTLEDESKAEETSQEYKDACKKPLIQPTLVNRVFAGLSVSSIRCLHCEQISTIKEQFLDISLDIVHPTKRNSIFSSFSSTISLQSLLERYFEVDRLNDSYLYDCEHCSRTDNSKGANRSESEGEQPNGTAILKCTEKVARIDDSLETAHNSGTSSNVNGGLEVHVENGSSSTCTESGEESSLDERELFSSLNSLSDSLSSISISSPANSTECLKISKRKSPVFRKAEKWFKIEIFPEVLVLHLKRFSSISRGRFTKSSEKISIPPTLDMTQFYYGEMEPANYKVLYELYALVIHIGTSMESGHYVAHVMLSGPEGKQTWFYCSDSTISKIDASKAYSPDAYILFYKRIS